MATTPPTDRYRAIITRRREDLAKVLDATLPRDRTFVWELGCGHGHFFTAYAQRHPERFCLGVDQDSDRIGRAQRKAQRAGLANLHFIQAEGRLFLDVLPADARFSDVYVLFPDPWPKSRHHKHRILQPEFLTHVAPRMAPHARLFFRTDFAPYFADAEQVIRKHPAWILTDDAWEFEHETVFQQRARAYHSLTARVRASA